MEDSPATVVAGRYALAEKLGEGGMGAVFRARDRLTGHPVAVKRLVVDGAIGGAHDPLGYAGTTEVGTVVPASDLRTRNVRGGSMSNDATAAIEPGEPLPADALRRVAIASEFRILASLRHPNIIAVLDYGFDRDRAPFLVLELLDGASSITVAARALPLPARVALVAQLLAALDYLHRRGIRHRDLKPSNVMVVDGRVRVLDFGLAIERGDAYRPAGTLGYIAPEILRGEPATARSDLWNIGVIAYEILTGRHPLGRDEAETARAIGRRIPPLSLDDAALGPVATAALIDTVGRLLEVEPEARPSSARQALRLLARTGLVAAVEDDDTRASTAATAPLVGRVVERAALAAGYTAARRGTGSAAVIVGAMGSGKSRLLDDLRTLALVDGATVAQGAEVVERGAGYHGWRSIVRRLALHARPDAAVPWPFLTLIVPDLGELLGQGPLAAPALDPQLLQAGVLAAVEALVRAVPGPIVVLYEELQWAGDESVALLARIAAIAGELPLQVVVTARPEALARAQAVPAKIHALGPLTRGEVATFAIAVLGPLGDRADLIELLIAGTSGLPRYLVEAMRLLAALAGSLDRVGTMTLPASLAIDVLDQALRERLERLPETARPLLDAAALAGAELELEMLSALVPDAALVEVLDVAERAGVLAVDLGGWRFTHERVRELVIERIAPLDRAHLHRRIASFLETHGGDAVALAWHARGADDRAREGRWAVVAGQGLLTRAAYARARGFLERGLELLDARQLAPSQRDAIELDLQLGIGTATLVTSGVAAAAAAFDRAGALCDQLGLAGGTKAFAVLFGQAATLLFRGEHDASHVLAERALRVAVEAKELDLEIEARFSMANAEFWMGRLAAAERNVERVVALWTDDRAAVHGERFGQLPRVTCMTAGAWGAWVGGRPDRALAMGEEALAIARSLGHGFSEAIAVQIVALVHALRRDVDATLRDAEALTRFGAPFPAYLIIARVLMAWAHANRERDPAFLDEMLAVWRDWTAIGYGVIHTLVSGLLADAYLLFGRAAEAEAIARDAIAWGQRGGERVLLADLHRLLGEARLAQDDRAGARAAFADALAAAAAIGADSLALRAAIAWARLERDAGDRVEARAILAPTLGRMRDGADTIDQITARALLAALVA